MSKRTVLVVDDNAINRRILGKILASDYSVLEAEDGATALEIFDANKESIAAVMLDLVMPVMDGYDFLREFSKREDSDKVPVIVSTGQTDKSNEVEALSLGAWDFITKPYFPEIIHFRLKNAILRSQLTAFQELKYKSEYDVLTGIYNKDKFFAETHDMLVQNQDRKFAFYRFDIDRFHLVNSYFGTDMGDRVLKYIANGMREACRGFGMSAYGRIEADIFAFCVEIKPGFKLQAAAESSITHLSQFNLAFDIVPSFGIYVVEDHRMSVDKIYDKASLAAKSCKGNCLTNYIIYDSTMGAAVEQEQEIINDMNAAVNERQFEIWYQPKYDIQRNVPAGAEALVRWRHPRKGMISPASFIPVFEHNGFISKLDYYVWEQVCRDLRSWLDDDRDVKPVSVNISRVDLSDPQLVDRIAALTDKYGIPHDLFNLELTESAYTDNPEKMIEIIADFQRMGFIIMMDDFGSGYSSLSILKDIDVSVLKIDMRFFAKTAIEGREKSIIASVIRMAKWLGIPVVAEGVEHKEQVEFLKGLGCEYVQGYFFAKPMPSEEYLEYVDEQTNIADPYEDTRFNADIIWNNEMMLSELTQPAAVIEYSMGDMEIIHVNNSFYDFFGYRDRNKNGEITLPNVSGATRDDFRRAFFEEIEVQRGTAIEYRRDFPDGRTAWIRMWLIFIGVVGEKSLMYALFTDITALKKLGEGIERYKNAAGKITDRAKILIVGDSDGEIARLFGGDYIIFGAPTTDEAILKIEAVGTGADAVILCTEAPMAEGRLLADKMSSNERTAKIPFIIITADGNDECRDESVRLGVSDYIVKPFDSKYIVKRVRNLIEVNRVLRKIDK